jgi:uncharacterized protein YaaN involved in tellurite resistance
MQIALVTASNDPLVVKVTKTSISTVPALKLRYIGKTATRNL